MVASACGGAAAVAADAPSLLLGPPGPGGAPSRLTARPARGVVEAQAGVAPRDWGLAPILGALPAVEKAGWSSVDLDLIEANEAFPAQACAFNKELGWDPERVNVNGGAIALGHPIGASGARILVTLLHEMKKRDAAKGLATLCIGGGMGIAMCVARD